MAIYKVTIDIESTEVLVEADNLEDAKSKGYDKFLQETKGWLLIDQESWVAEAEEE